MIGVVLAAHGEVAPALLKAAEAIVGPLPQVKAISLSASEDCDCMRGNVAQAVHEVATEDGVLFLCDMFGGTPANVCLTTECGTPVEVVTGVNLPMVIKVATVRASGISLEDAAALIAQYGQRHITHASAVLRAKRRAVMEKQAAEQASLAAPPRVSERTPVHAPLAAGR